MTAMDDLELPATPTDPRWVAVALADLDAVHRDHLHCERKAAQSALSLVRSYPDRPDLVDTVARLAHEETAHVVQVSALLARRGTRPSWDLGDDYAAALRGHVRRREPDRLLDRLLVFALIEARSAERLALLAGALPDPATASLYRALATAEVRHRDAFLELAAAAAPAAWRARAAELAVIESEIVAWLPLRPRIH
jgi:tRNA 2-(methylsulfanyl)-N6-isopentenyladenosine37 hydroxylase